MDFSKTIGIIVFLALFLGFLGWLAFISRSGDGEEDSSEPKEQS